MKTKPAILVTGGSAGIGLELARRFAVLKHPDIVIVGRDPMSLHEASETIARGTNATVHVLVLDLLTLNAADQVEAFLGERSLFVDVLVNNAGVGLSGAFEGQCEEAIRNLIRLNVEVPSILMRRFLPGMCDRRRGGVLNIASLGGYVPGPGQAAYYASKAFLISLTKAVRHEVRGKRVKISVVAPGPVMTRFHAKMGADNARYRWLMPQASARWVARVALAGYGLGFTVIFPGPISFLGALGARLLPNVLLAPLVGWLLGPERTQAVRSKEGKS